MKIVHPSLGILHKGLYAIVVLLVFTHIQILHGHVCLVDAFEVFSKLATP
jgi:hypothetical protein